MKCEVGPKVTFLEGGKVGRSDTTPILRYGWNTGPNLILRSLNLGAKRVDPIYPPPPHGWIL